MNLRSAPVPGSTVLRVLCGDMHSCFLAMVPVLGA
jgi:hypothetical protein